MLRSLLVTIFFSSFRLLRILLGGPEVLFQGFWMGALPEPLCDLISMRYLGDGRSYTGTEYLDSGLHFWEDLAISRFFTQGRVLVAAAGGGREMIALARRGFEVDGFDCSKVMVAAGRQALAERGLQGRIDWAPPCKAPEILQQYDSLVVGWNGYTAMAPRKRRVAFLQSLRPHLLPGSPILVSVALRAGAGRNAVWTPRIANAVRICTFRAPIFEAGALFPGRPKHYFTRKQLEGELTEAGFSPVEFYRWGPYGAVVCISR
jgi:hypothetical protein